MTMAKRKRKRTQDETMFSIVARKTGAYDIHISPTVMGLFGDRPRNKALEAELRDRIKTLCIGVAQAMDEIQNGPIVTPPPKGSRRTPKPHRIGAKHLRVVKPTK
jgi:hypothetical protein